MMRSGRGFRLVFGGLCMAALAGVLGCGQGAWSVQGSGSGAAVSRTFSVSSFGAKGDGVADDGAAIQQAMTAAEEAGGGTVVFPCGEFAVKSLQGGAPGGRSALYLHGASGVQLSGQGRCTHVFTAIEQVSLFEFAQSQQVAVTAMRLTVPNVVYVETYGMDGGSAVRFTGVSHGSVKQVEVDGATAGAIYFTAGTSDSVAANNYVHDTYGSAIWEDDCGGASQYTCAPSLPPSHNVYSENTLTDTSAMMYGAISVDDGSGVTDSVIEGNTVSWTHLPAVGTGENACIDVNNASGVSVLNNVCTGAPWYGIVLSTGAGSVSADVTVEGNTITSPGWGAVGGSGIVVYNGTQGQSLSGFTLAYNTIYLSAGDGITINDASMAGRLRDGQVLNNTITMADQRVPGTSFGINVDYSASIASVGNTIQCNGRCIAAGVNVDGSVNSTPAVGANAVIQILGVPVRVQ